MERRDDGRVAVCEEALQVGGRYSGRMSSTRCQAPGLKVTEEDLGHLEDCIFMAQGNAVSMPGVEHLYAKLHRHVRGKLPPQQ